MSRLAVGCLTVALISIGTAASAADRIRLSNQQMDAITAGAISGALVRAVSFIPGGGSSTSTSSRTFSGPLDANAFRDDGTSTAAAEIAGEVITRDSDHASYSIGVFRGSTETSGTGEAGTDAQPIAEGDFTIAQSYAFRLPGNQTLHITLGAAIDRPIFASQ